MLSASGFVYLHAFLKHIELYLTVKQQSNSYIYTQQGEK